MQERSDGGMEAAQKLVGLCHQQSKYVKDIVLRDRTPH